MLFLVDHFSQRKLIAFLNFLIMILFSTLRFFLDKSATVLSGTVVDLVISELESCGFQCFTAGIGGKGVEICFAVSS